MSLEPIFNIAEICAKKGIEHVILSPGSRCAALTLAFVRHPDISTRTISDERSAAFIALGMSQQTKRTVALVCTSGSAAYNYAPAVAEAYFQQIPLLILTADRPPEWIDQLDGQTIRQENIYGKHVKKSYSLPVDYSHADAQWQVTRVINEAINTSREFPQGPVHINIPFREPFYPEKGEQVSYDKGVKIIDLGKATYALEEKIKEKLMSTLDASQKILIIVGQQDFDISLLNAVNYFSTNNGIPVVADVISNFQRTENAIIHQDAFLSHADKSLAPDFLITFGKSVISKQLKTYLRKNKPKQHWHIQEAGDVADTFQSLTKIIRTTAEVFFQGIKKLDNVDENQVNYLNQWKEEDTKFKNIVSELFDNQEFSEFEAVKLTLKNVPKNSNLHLANSMSVRYANYIGIKGKAINVYCNRGTSGIDGCTSTALGFALDTDEIVTLITGDMAFFYDRNAFWNNAIPSNLRIIILNNHGGGIFGLIDGPSQQPELEEYFVTDQRLTAENLAKDHVDIDYFKGTGRESLQSHLKEFFNEGDKAKILEIATDKLINKRIFTIFKNKIKE